MVVDDILEGGRLRRRELVVPAVAGVHPLGVGAAGAGVVVVVGPVLGHLTHLISSLDVRTGNRTFAY